MNLSRRLASLVMILSLGVAGCGGASHPATEGDAGVALDPQGSYALAIGVDVPPTVLATQPAADFIELLRLLRDDPAAAFFELLDQAGVPLVKDLYGVLPGPLQGQVRDAINDDWRGRMTAGGPASELDQVIAFADGTLTRFTLGTRLDVPAAASSGPAPGHHAVESIAFDAAGGVAVPLPRSLIERLPLTVGPLDADPRLAVTAPLRAGAGEAHLTLGDHFFGLAYGEIVFAALDGGVTGEPLRARLGRAFDCPAMGRAVASRCVSLLCIGHATEITQICEKALDAAVDKVHASLSGLSFRAVRFEEGGAELWDAATAGGARDGRAERIDGGAFTKASLDVGTGPRACRASFSGRRIP